MTESYHFTPASAGKFICQGRGKHVTRQIPTWELIFVLKETLEMFIGDKKNCYTVPAGNCLLLPANTPHGSTHPYHRNLSFYWLHFMPQDPESEQFLKSVDRCFPVQNPSRLISYYQLFLSFQADPTPDVASKMDIIRLILREACKRPSQESDGAAVPDILLHTKQLISLHYMEDLSTSSLAKKLHHNPDYLGKLFKKHFKMTIAEYINATRIRRAAVLLEECSMPIGQIAYECGFNDPAYFRRCFFQSFSVTPKAYRNRLYQEQLNTQ